MTVADVLAGPLPSAGIEEPFLGALADPKLGLVRLWGVPSEPARMVQGLYAFHTAVLDDQLFDYLREEDGNDLPDVLGWCEEIGAERARSLVQALLNLFPTDLRDDPAGRATYLNDLDEQASHGVSEALAASQWDDVLEIPDRLRDYIRKHLKTFEAAQAKAPRYFG